MNTQKHLLIPIGSSVRTTCAHRLLREQWGPGVWEKRQWGVQGQILVYHNSHRLYYEVLHPDGTVGCYDPSELEITMDSVSTSYIGETGIVQTGPSDNGEDGGIIRI